MSRQQAAIRFKFTGDPIVHIASYFERVMASLLIHL